MIVISQFISLVRRSLSSALHSIGIFRLVVGPGMEPQQRLRLSAKG